MTEPTIAQKLRANLEWMRKNGKSREEMQAEINRAQSAISERNAGEMTQAKRLAPHEVAMGAGLAAAQGFSVNLADEAIGVGSPERRAAVRDIQSRMSEQYPVTQFAGEVIGGIASPLKFFRAAPAAAGVLRRGGTVLAEGAAQGMANVFGASEGDAIDRATGLPAGAAAGAGTAGALAGVVKGGQAVSRLAGRAAGNVVDELVEQLANRGLTPNQVRETVEARLKKLKDAGVADLAMLADILPGGDSMLRAEATANPEIRQRLNDRVGQRANYLATRADLAFTNATGFGRVSPGAFLKQLERDLSDKVAPIYQSARQQAAEATARGESILQRVRDVIEGQRPKALPAPGQTADALALSRAMATNPPGSPAPPNRAVRRRAAREAGEPFAPNEQRPAQGAVGDFAGAQDGLADVRRAQRDAIADGIEERPIVVRARNDAQTVGRPAGLDPAPKPQATPRGPSFFQLADDALADPNVQEADRLVRGDPTAPSLKGADKYDHDYLLALRHQLSADLGAALDAPPSPEIRRQKAGLRNALAKLDQAIELRAPDAGEARQVYAGGMSLARAFDAGTRAAKDESAMAAMEAADLMRAGGGDGVVQAFRAGQAQGLRPANVPNPDIGAGARMTDLFEPIKTVERATQFRDAFGDQAYQKYLSDLQTMVKLQRSQFGRGESATIDKLLEQAKTNPAALAEIGTLLAGGRLTGAALYTAREAGRLGHVMDRVRKLSPGRTNAARLEKTGEGQILEELARITAEMRDRATPGPRGGSLSSGQRAAARAVAGRTATP